VGEFRLPREDSTTCWVQAPAVAGVPANRGGDDKNIVVRRPRDLAERQAAEMF